jgi:hypothetical protein
MSIVFNYFFMNAFKIYGFMLGYKDTYLTYLGAIGLFFGTLTRIFLPSFINEDEMTYKNQLSVVLIA